MAGRKIASTTAQTVEDVLHWVETTPHHFASWIEEPGFFVLKGGGRKLRIPEAIQAKTHGLVEPGGFMDARMYRATKSGRARLRRAERALSSEAQPLGAAGKAEAALQHRMSLNPPPPHPIGNGEAAGAGACREGPTASRSAAQSFDGRGEA